MNVSNVGTGPDSRQKEEMMADGRMLQPMSQQDVADTHGHEMHPQKFVRLVGCHEENAARHNEAWRLH